MKEEILAAIQKKTWIVYKYQAEGLVFHIYTYISNVKLKDDASDDTLSKYRAIVYMRYKSIKFADGRGDYGSKVETFPKPFYQSLADPGIVNTSLHKSWEKDTLIDLFNTIFKT